MKKTMIIIIITFLISSLSAVEVLSLENALQLAIQNNSELKASANDMLSAQKTMQSSYLSLGPSASLSYRKTYSDPATVTSLGSIDETSSLELSASQGIFNGGKTILSAQMQKNAYKIQKAGYKSKLLDITASVEQKYYEVQASRERLQALEKNLEQSTANLEIAQAKLEAGLFSNAEFLQMKSEKMSSELDLINAQNAYEISKMELANLLEYSEPFEVEEFDITMYGSLLDKLNQTDITAQKQLEAELIKLGEKNNPTLTITQLQIDNAKKSKIMAAGNFLPSLNLSYSYGLSNNNLDSDYDDSSTLALVASLPIFPLADNALDYQSAKYDLRSTENSSKNTENSITLAIRSSCLNLFTSARRVESAEVNKELAWETWAQMREQFEQGLISSTDLLSTEVSVINSDYNYISARQSFLEAISSLKNLLGMEDREQLINILDKSEE